MFSADRKAHSKSQVFRPALNCTTAVVRVLEVGQ